MMKYGIHFVEPLTSGVDSGRHKDFASSFLYNSVLAKTPVKFSLDSLHRRI